MIERILRLSVNNFFESEVCMPANLSKLVLIILVTGLALRGQAQSLLAQPVAGSIGGVVLDPSGALIAGARISLTRNDHSQGQDALSGADGHFLLTNVKPGSFEVSIGAPGFASETVSGMLHPGESYSVPETTLLVASASTEIEVGLSPTEVAEEQIQVEEKQVVFGAIPNYYVSYLPNAKPLNSKQKFELAWKSTFAPVNFALTAAVAGIQQANDDFKGYGQGAQGYGKRYAASYAGFTAGSFIGNYLLPSLLRQDPRYFYKGVGTKRARILYAMANAVICKGDNGRWQPNYSAVLGGMAAGAISNLYYPAADRSGAGLTFENAGFGIAGSAVGNIVEEFFLRRLTSHARNGHAELN
jgi:hypothetical protein